MIAFLIPQEILRSHPFLMSQKFKMQGCQWYGVKWIKSIFANKGIVEQGLRQLFITSSGSYFFHKADLEQNRYLLKINSVMTVLVW